MTRRILCRWYYDCQQKEHISKTTKVDSDGWEGWVANQEFEEAASLYF